MSNSNAENRRPRPASCRILRRSSEEGPSPGTIVTGKRAAWTSAESQPGGRFERLKNTKASELASPLQAKNDSGYGYRAKVLATRLLSSYGRSAVKSLHCGDGNTDC